MGALLPKEGEMGLQRMEPNAHGYSWCWASSSSQIAQNCEEGKRMGVGSVPNRTPARDVERFRHVLSRPHSSFFVVVPGQPGCWAVPQELDLGSCVAGGREMAKEQLLKGKVL